MPGHTEEGEREMKSIRTKLIVGTSTVTAIFVLTLGIVSGILTYTSADSQLRQGIASMAEVASDRVTEEITGYVRLAEAFGGRSDIADPEVPVEQKESILSAWAEKYGMQRANLLDRSGYSLFDGNSYADREYYQKGMQGQTFVSTPVVSKVTGELTIIVAAPLWQDGQPDTTVVGVVYFIPKETFLNDIMSGIKISENGSAYMIDNQGNTIADTTLETVTTQNIEKEAESDSSLSALASIHAAMREGQSGVGDYTMDGVDKVAGYAPVDETDGWSLAVTTLKSDFMGATVRSLIVVTVLVVLSLIVNYLFIRRIAKRIADPICRCTDRIETLSKGDIHSEVPKIDSEDETGRLARATSEIVDCLQGLIRDEGYVLGEMAKGNFNVTADQSVYRGDLFNILKSLKGINRRLTETLHEISDAAEQVAAGSDQVATGAQALSQGATEQASSVEELAATVNEINEKVQENAKFVKKSNDVSNEAGSLLMESMEKMQAMSEAMEEISSSSGEISRIIKTIEDIAFQTNILALNAAVEAARAGNAGKGFAVVADEVRSLAEKSAEASKTTSELIERSIHAVENGMKIATETSESLQNTATSAREAINLNGEIDKNSRAQAEAVGQVTLGIDQISSVIQTNSATAQQSAAASEELSGQADLLKKTVSAFQLKDLSLFDEEEAAMASDEQEE